MKLTRFVALALLAVAALPAAAQQRQTDNELQLVGEDSGRPVDSHPRT